MTAILLGALAGGFAAAAAILYLEVRAGRARETELLRQQAMLLDRIQAGSLEEFERVARVRASSDDDDERRRPPMKRRADPSGIVRTRERVEP